MTRKIEKVLLAKRTTDGKFLKLSKLRLTPELSYVEEPELA